MNQSQRGSRRVRPLMWGVLIVTGLLTLTETPASAQKPETIDATATGTGAQLGTVVDVSLEIYQFSTIDDRQTLVKAFEKGQNQGLVNALSKMKAVGHISITGTLGYDLSFIRLIPTPTGRKIRFVTNRPIRMAEAWSDAQSQAFNLTAGEIDLNDQEKNKSSGMLFPAAQLVIDKQGQLQMDLNQNAWKLVDIIDWKGTQGVN